MLLKANWQGLNALSVMFIALLVAACSSDNTPPPEAQAPSAPSASLQPVKSPSDEYQYRYLTLPNEMQVLLISDPDTVKAAAALDVNVGSGDNPPDRQGLAHFLEHMLFLGTEKYPDPAEYEQYITEHGGSRNAFTSLANTNYFFDINAEFLPEALDRFAQFFIAPTFDEAYVEREREVVDAEFQMGLKSDGRRNLDVLQTVMNPEHPYSRFTVGSFETLADRPGSSIRDELISFYDSHYSANIMRLVVLGTESLDELEAMVVPLFSAVPNNNFQQGDIEAPLFLPDSLPKLVSVKPQATLRQLDLSFPIPDYRNDYDAKPLSYLGNLVGHEGKGSLLSQLKAEGLAEGLSAGQGLTWRGGGMFSVSISLTEKGLKEYPRILELFFSYMDMLRQKGAQEWLYDEQARIADLTFRFKSETPPMNYVSQVAGGMQLFSSEHILQGPYMMDRYDEVMINGLMEQINANNVVVTLTDSSVETDEISPYYKVPFARQTVGKDEVAVWTQGSGEASLHLPEPNQFIASNVALVPREADPSRHPVRLLERPRKSVWFMQDQQFDVPKGATYINFRSPEVGASARQTAAAVLYTAVLKDDVNEYTYPALLAGLSFNFYKHAQGISLRLTGYNDKQALLLEELLKVVADPKFNPQRFENIRIDLIRALENSVAGRPTSQVINDLREALLYGEWGEQALIAQLQQMDLAELKDYARSFWAGATAEALIYGNYEKSYADQVANMLDAVIETSPAPELPDLRVLQLAAGESLQYDVKVPHDDAVVAWYLQGAGTGWRDLAATGLTAQIIKSGFFQQLRTEQQLGYVVNAFDWPQLEVPGLVLLIQSPIADAPKVVDAMSTFMASVGPGLDKAQFERNQAALLSDILKPDKNLWERADFYWQSIARKQYEFDGRKQIADAVREFNLEDWLAYYQTVFVDQRHSLQVIAPGKSGALPKGKYDVFESADAIKQGHASYLIQ
ncbi:MAG: insulinase family protein [Pseudomonadota bacterium]